AGPQYSAVGQKSLLTQVFSNVLDGELLLETGFSLAGEHRLNVGGSGRVKRVGWDYLGANPRTQVHAAAFIQDEWEMQETFRIIASSRIDRHPLLDNGQPGYAQSP